MLSLENHSKNISNVMGAMFDGRLGELKDITSFEIEITKDLVSLKIEIYSTILFDTMGLAAPKK